MDYLNLPILIPSYQPDDRLLTLLCQLTEAGFCNLVVVDDGSGSAYADYFTTAEQKYHCHLLRHPCNLGKGRALKNGFGFILQQWPDALGCVTADSDGQHSPTCIGKCADTLCQNPDALVLGVRDFGGEQVPFKSKWGNKITCLSFRFLCGVAVSDTQTGLRAIPCRFMQDLLATDGERFEFESNMLIETRKGTPCIEVPIETIYDSKENHTSHFHPVRDSIRIYKIFGAFLISSLSSTAIDLTLFQLFVWLFAQSVSYYIILATLLARGCSAIYNFTLNRSLVFQSNTPLSHAACRYALLCAVQGATSACLVTAIHNAFPTWELIIKLFVDITLFFISFHIQRAFVFVHKKQKA